MSYDYEVILRPRAQRELDSFRGEILAKLESLILGLRDNPRPSRSIKLKGGGSNWRIRTGDYRILYEVNDIEKVVKVYRIAHRKDVYR